ncbi:unnamed protein product [Alternaria sp. RS040]
MCESRTNLERLGHFGESELIELMCIALAAGASPDCRYLDPTNATISIASFKKLVENTPAAVAEGFRQFFKAAASASRANELEEQWPTTRSFGKPFQNPSYHEQFASAIKKKNLVLAYQLLQDRLSLTLPSEFVELAVSLGQSDMIVNVIRSAEDLDEWNYSELFTLLRHGQITAVSALLTRHPAWNSALNAACYHEDFGTLEAMVFQESDLPLLEHLGNDSYLLIQEQQEIFRVIAFHAIATDDLKLCKWLFQIGMDADELHLYDGEDNGVVVVKTPATYCSLAGVGGCPVRDYWCTIPSLLAVAAQHNYEEWMKHLLAQGVRSADSGALLWASSIATIRFLLGAAEPGNYSGQRNYGIAALREAIRPRDFAIIDILCEAVNIDAIEPSTEELLEHEAPLSPLGEAIILGDIEIVQFLLKRGASPNAYVSFDGLRMLERIESHIQRVTPLLAVIDMQSLPLVKLLLEHGAEVDYKRNMGVFRTPLQRSAAMGCFDIVQCLIEQSEIIDTIPIHSGGTALQLAALNGFCGIAAFLLERGADPNHPPAKGDGRTAFEAAAEWSHVDTMSLLMQYNANLDLEVGEPPESQHERAKRFAEKNGFMASKRFVEHLYRQTLGQ